MEPTPTHWLLNLDHASKARFTRVYAGNPREYFALFSNLEKFRQLLCGGAKGCPVEFVRPENEGILQVSHVVPGLDYRLIILAHEPTRTIYLLNIGAAETRPDDLKASKEIARKIRAIKP